MRSALPPTPERTAQHVHRRVAVSLTFRRFLSPLDTDPSRRLPRGPAPGCEDPWAAARARRTSPAPCGMRLSPTGVRRPPGLRGTALVLRRRAARTNPRRGATPRQPAGHYGEWPNWANALEQPPARLRGGCARVRKPRPGARLHGKAQSGQRASLMTHPGPGRVTIRLPVVG